jgi:hypothetical protein
LPHPTAVGVIQNRADSKAILPCRPANHPGVPAMDRRQFLQTGLQTATVAAVASSSCPTIGAEATAASQTTPPILKTYTADDHRRRLQNIALGTREIRKCMRKHLVTNYLPAQCVYNLGEYQKAWEYYQAHPNGPYIYGGWDANPPRAETQAVHARWLKRYMPLVEDGTWAWLEVGESNLFAKPMPQGVVASVFANRELYMVLANYGNTAAEIETTAAYTPTDQSSAAPAKQWSLPPRSLQILRRTAS